MIPKKALSIFFCISFFATNLYSFDHAFYTATNNLPLTKKHFAAALYHFARVGKKAGLKSTATHLENTNFDWEYYVKHNKLTHIIPAIATEHEAYQHYKNYGEQQQLPYCKKFDLMIMLHLYDLDMMAEMISRINYFINNNPHNTYRIKINVPVTEKILTLLDFFTGYAAIEEKKAQAIVQKHISTLGNFPTALINQPLYASTLHHLLHYLQKAFVIPHNNIQVVFSENKGMDIGGFFVLLNELKKGTVSFDYLVKIHTKKGPISVNKPLAETWKDCLMSFLNVKINKLLRVHDAVYPCIMNSFNDPERYNKVFTEKQKHLCELLGISIRKKYDFCAGTTFIVPYRFFSFVKKWDFNKIYSLFEYGHAGRGYEHVFERLFGYVGGQVSSNIICFDAPPRGCAPLHDID